MKFIMITTQLIKPNSIAVIGGSNDLGKPGGRVLNNLINGKFPGKLYVVNPKESEVQGIKSYAKVDDLPQTDMAIIAIAAKYTPETVEVLAKSKDTKAFIILSAGFSEMGGEGVELEHKVVEIIDSVGGALIGPNCIGALTPYHNGIFTLPVPQLDPMGVDFVTGSGATAVFILETAIPRGMRFASLYSVGNSAQIGVEEVLEYWDNNFDAKISPKVKMVYLENIDNPEKFFKHSYSLIQKGCKIAAIKAGASEAGSRAASSHTGALASSDLAVSALFKKAGIVRCYSRTELVDVCGVMLHPELKGENVAIITHAGGPGVILTDTLSECGLKVPKIEGAKADELLGKLFPGSSVANPIDFLATGTAEQLGVILDYVDKDFDAISGAAVIYGTPGLFDVQPTYKVLDEKMKSLGKPIYPVLPSPMVAKEAVEYFVAQNRFYFPDEAGLGRALAKVYATKTDKREKPNANIDEKAIRSIIDSASDGYLSPEGVAGLLDAVGLPRAKEMSVENLSSAKNAAQELGFPLVMKVVGPVHKSDVGGVVLNVKDIETVEKEFNRLMTIKDAVGVLLQQMASGSELFVGANREKGFGHVVICGLGGIFIEILKDISASIGIIDKNEALDMIRSLKGYKLIQGARGKEGVNEDIFADIISKVSLLLSIAPEISEMDINPLLGKKDSVMAVDARICIAK